MPSWGGVQTKAKIMFSHFIDLIEDYAKHAHEKGEPLNELYDDKEFIRACSTLLSCHHKLGGNKIEKLAEEVKDYIADEISAYI